MPELPAMTPTAHLLNQRFTQLAIRQKWTPNTRQVNEQTLRILTSWLGAEAPIPEADVRALKRDRSYLKIRRVLTFLAEQQLLEPAPDKQNEPLERQVQAQLGQYSGEIGEELRQWVAVLRGQGRLKHRVMRNRTIYNYLCYAGPVLRQWLGRVTSLREITRDDVHAAVKCRQGGEAHQLMVALRSLFRALKQERLVFVDPTRGISVTRREALPVLLPADHVAGLLDRTDSAIGRLLVLLVALHAIGVEELRHIMLDDLDLARGRLTIPKATTRWIVYLPPITLQVLDTWLRERHQRWPTTSNPYLLVSQQTAAEQVTVSRQYIATRFAPLNVTPSKLRQDRILDEARHTADPVHLMRVFGISDTTAMKYVYTAHPERQSGLSSIRR
ncbi:hypothetical protein [Actinomadura geliboluensis]|uniref:hypothetical protein n=1 Tax=Actinomadura geliboluensis TaxID=882440 RepID=UPI002632CC02|nr:hypothetical protein [Actinomadura geliboluensis]